MEQDTTNFCISIAGHSFGIHAVYPRVFALCREYITTAPAEKEIYITDVDIDAEIEEASEEERIPKRSYLETLAVYRKISEEILDYNIFLMHGAVVAHADTAYMFTAASGTGKTTHIMKWLENLDDAYVVNGDKPLIKITDKEIIACGTPWCGKERLGNNCMVPMKAIAFMERGEKNEIKEITFEDAITFLMKQTYMPKNAALIRKTLELVSKMKNKVKMYKFVFNNMRDDAFEVAYNAMK